MLRVPIRASALSPLCSARLSARLLSGAPKKVDTALVKELRVRTSAPMKKCVEALQASGGADVEAAIAWLRKAGVASASKKASRDANEGAVVLTQRDDALALVEVNSETDFVSRNDVFFNLRGDVTYKLQDWASITGALIYQQRLSNVSSAEYFDVQPRVFATFTY